METLIAAYINSENLIARALRQMRFLCLNIKLVVMTIFVFLIFVLSDLFSIIRCGGLKFSYSAVFLKLFYKRAPFRNVSSHSDK